MCHQGIDQLGIADFLQQAGWPAQQIQLALTHIISLATYPADELGTCDWIQQNSAVCELTGYPLEKITKDKLYEVSKELYSVKKVLEKHLSKCTNELFDLDDKIIIYDLTNTYFEGSMRSSKIAKFGRSKEKRSDAKLIVLAVVVNTEGFLKYSQIFEGNMADCNTVQNIIDELSARTSATEKHPIVVLDAGIATEDNLALLKKNGFDYLCVSRSGMKNYSIDIAQKPIVIKDKKDQPVTLLKAVMPNSTDNWLQVHSEAKAMKESGMNSRFSQALEQGLTQIKESNGKKRDVKKQAKVWERIGRLKGKYPSINKPYEIVIQTNKAGIVTSINWKQKTIENKDGFYLLRTTLDEKDETVQWTIYNTIREVGATFRVLKTDLDLRPIYHKTDEASMAHLHLGLLAYWVVNTIRHQLKQKGINTQWKDIVRTMSTQKLVTTNLTNEFDQPIIIRQCSEPTEAVAKIYEALKYKHKPFTRKKSVVPRRNSKKIKIKPSAYLWMANAMWVKGFVVEKSIDSIHFKTIGYITGNGNGQILNNYSAEDNQPLKGLNYYRLKMETTNSGCSYSHVVSINLCDESLLKITPNPVKNILKLVTNLNNEMAILQVIDNNGMKLKEIKTILNGSVSIDVYTLPLGTYNLQIITKKGINILRFIIE